MNMNFTKLTKERLDINAISERVADDTCGAISLFVGTTRDNFEDKRVSFFIHLIWNRSLTTIETQKICIFLKFSMCSRCYP